MSLVKKVQNTCFHNELFKRGDKIVLAVSGGPDSVVMLDVFACLAPKYDLGLMIAHVNYGLRGAHSDRDEKFVRELAGKYNLEIIVENAGARLIETLRNKKNISENELRNIRYKFFEKLRKENRFDLIAVAHNADDQVETYLMRIIRGAGIRGLSAMRFKNDRIIRPLLGIYRTEIMDYLEKNKLDWRIDKTNLEEKYFRNKIRNKLIPYLEKNFNPSLKKTIFDSTLSVASDHDFIADAAENYYGKIFVRQNEARYSASCEDILKLHPSIQRRVLRKAIKKVKADLKNIDASHIEEILKIAKSTKSKSQFVLIQGLKISRKGDKINVEKSKNNSDKILTS